jgi:HlyD family secretion protein
MPHGLQAVQRRRQQMQATQYLIVRMWILGLAAAGVSSLAQQSGPEPVGSAGTTNGPVSGIDTTKGVVVSCQVERGAKILSLLPDGTLVKKGDLICELDASDLKDRLIDHTISVKRAESENKIAQLSHEAAVRDLQEFEEATYIYNKAAFQREIKHAESMLAEASDQVDEVNKLWEQGKLSRARKVAAELALQETKFALELAQSKLSSLENYTRPNAIKRLRSEIVKALSREQTAKEVGNLERARAEKTRLQIENCRITAPCDGRLALASPPASVALLGEGDRVHERQRLFRVIPLQP